MGLALPSLRYLVREHKKNPFGEKVLVLGRQYVFATFNEVLDLMKKENYVPVKLDSDFMSSLKLLSISKFAIWSSFC